MHVMSLVDELAELRLELARARAREAELREALLAGPPALRTGRWHRAEIATQSRRLFDKALLPEVIRACPDYWREQRSQIVRILPVQAGPARS